MKSAALRSERSLWSQSHSLIIGEPSPIQTHIRHVRSRLANSRCHVESLGSAPGNAATR